MKGEYPMPHPQINVGACQRARSVVNAAWVERKLSGARAPCSRYDVKSDAVDLAMLRARDYQLNQ